MKQYRIEAGKRCFSDVPGAVFVSRATDGWCSTSPAMMGIKKVHGCVDFEICMKTEFDVRAWFTSIECEKIYYDEPNEEEAWLVLPDGTGCEWIRIDDQIDFS